MNIRKIFTAAGFVAVLFGTAACSKNRFDINSNPDDITEESVVPADLLSASLSSTATLIGKNWDFLNMWMGHWARNGTYQSMTSIETYNFTTEFKDEIWEALYLNAGNYNLMQKKAVETGAGFFEAIGRTMKAHNFQILVDIYGNVPYFEAFRGIKLKTPKYDAAAVVYTDLFKQLDTAVSLLNDQHAIDVKFNPDLESSDLLFNGDAHKWLQFINTLRLRLLIHLHNGLNGTQVVDGFDIAAQVAKITVDGYLGTGESAMIDPGYASGKPNPYYREFVEDENGISNGEIYRANKYAIDYYNYNGDPRIDAFYVPGASGHAGSILGRPSDGNPLYNGSNLSTNRGPGLLPDGEKSSAWILTSVESMFLQAEAAERGIISGSPKGLLEDAVHESFTWLGLAPSDADEYLAANEGYPDVDYDAPPAGAALPGGGLYTILTQKWLALNSVAPYELWTDYRRTDFVLGIGSGFAPGPPISIDPGNTHTHIPVRLFYPQNEYNYNSANVAAQGTIDVFTSKIFWDLN